MSHLSSRDHGDGVLVLTIDRPPANALDLGLIDELVEAAGQLARDPPRAVVLAGRPGFFSAGVDLKLAPGYGPEEQRRMIRGINAMALGIYTLPCPVIGAVTGHAIAGGLVLALCTDLRIASSEGRHGLTEVKVGVGYPQAAIGLVASELSPQTARMLALGSELCSAEDCLRLGVFDELVAPDAALPRALEVAAGLTEFPREVYARTKHDLRAITAERLRKAASDDPLLPA